MDNFRTKDLFLLSLVVAVFCTEPDWLRSFKVYTIYHMNQTWNEAREICDVNNGTLLKIPDTSMWNMWLDVLDPTQGYQSRDISIYWFGLHAPNVSDLTTYYWDDCSNVEWIEWKTSVNRQAYTPTDHCGFIDVYFNPFTTVLMKLWAMKPCNELKYFICESEISIDTNICSKYACQEYILLMEDQVVTDCDDVCSTDSSCNSRYFNVSDLSFCHIYPSTTVTINGSLNMCYVAFPDYPLGLCNSSTVITDFSGINDTYWLPDNECLYVELETTAKTTTETLTTVLSTSRTTGTETTQGTTGQTEVTEHTSTTEKQTHAITAVADTTIETTTNDYISQMANTSIISITDTTSTITTTTNSNSNQTETTSSISTTINSDTQTIRDSTENTTPTEITERLCPCRCQQIPPTSSTLTLEEQVDQIKKELTVDRKNTSSHKRKYISVQDPRPSATGIGSLGIGILVTVLLSIFLMDLATLKNDLLTMFYNIKSVCAKNQSSSEIAIKLRKKSMNICSPLSRKNNVALKTETEFHKQSVEGDHKPTVALTTSHPALNKTIPHIRIKNNVTHMDSNNSIHANRNNRAIEPNTANDTAVTNDFPEWHKYI